LKRKCGEAGTDSFKERKNIYMAMTNRQVIAIFIIGIALLLAAFWAGLNVARQDTSLTRSHAVTTNAAATGALNIKQEPGVAPAPGGEARYIVRVSGSFGTLEKANQLTMELRRKYPSAYTQNPTGEDTLYRVHIGPYNTREDAQQVVSELAAQGFKGVMIFPWKGN
jgi:cell division protein FtsN